LFNPNSGYPAQTKTASFYGNANVGGTNLYFLRTKTNGSSNGLVHEGISKSFYYGSNFYYNALTYNNTGGNDEWIELHSLTIEGPTSSLWGDFNDGNENYGYGRYSP